MDIRKIDKNFNLPQLTEQDVVWQDATEPCFSLHGVFYSPTDGKFCHMPLDIAQKVSPGYAYAAGCTAGGRVRFQTDSPYIAIKAVVPSHCIMPHMPLVGSSGFSLYVDGIFRQMFTPDVHQFVTTPESSFAFQGVSKLENKKMRSFELYFPLYNGVEELFIGVQENSVISPFPYERKEKIAFYGSSITQGGCASRPGNDYISHLSRWLNVDCINFGASGNARGEKEIADYLSSLGVDAYILDYDHNAPNAEHLQNTHYPLYETIRTENPASSIVFISKPDFNEKNGDGAHREVIKQTYERAKAQGDKKVYFIDGETLFEKDDRDACTVDGCHPNDLGFYRMAKTIYPVLKEILK